MDTYKIQKELLTYVNEIEVDECSFILVDFNDTKNFKRVTKIFDHHQKINQRQIEEEVI